MTVRELAAKLQKSASWVYKEVARNRLPCLHIGASVRFDRRDVELYIRGDWKPQPPSKVVKLPKRGA